MGGGGSIPKDTPRLNILWVTYSVVRKSTAKSSEYFTPFECHIQVEYLQQVTSSSIEKR